MLCGSLANLFQLIYYTSKAIKINININKGTKMSDEQETKNKNISNASLASLAFLAVLSRIALALSPLLTRAFSHNSEQKIKNITPKGGS
jgi:hypothetical protein